MASQKDPANRVHRRSRTHARIRSQAVGWLREPAVFRSPTYVFSTPEAAERAFDLATGRAQPHERRRLELIYSRISHPNAEILEDQIVPFGAAAPGRPRYSTREWQRS